MFTPLVDYDADASRLNITLDGLHWVSNYEKTRWFLVLRVQKPKDDSLNRLLRISNRSLALFDQPPLYESSNTHITAKDSKRQQERQSDERNMEDYSHCFHISLAWSLTNPSPTAKERAATIDLQNLRGLTVHFNSVKAKIGNNVSSIPLAVGIRDERTIGGL